jgi:hypothetical protein
MSATIARREGHEQLEQSDMHLAWNMAKIAKGGVSRTAIEETQQLTNKPCTDVREEQKRGVVFPWHIIVKAAIERHPVMVRENQTDHCLSGHYGTAKHPLTHWRLKGMAAPPN